LVASTVNRRAVLAGVRQDHGRTRICPAVIITV
jgi:hypothetical protein